MSSIFKEKMTSQKECMKALVDGGILSNGDITVKMTGKGLINVKTKEKYKECFASFKGWFRKPDPKKLYAYGYPRNGTSPSGERITSYQILFYSDTSSVGRAGYKRLEDYDIDYEMEV